MQIQKKKKSVSYLNLLKMTEPWSNSYPELSSSVATIEASPKLGGLRPTSLQFSMMWFPWVLTRNSGYYWYSKTIYDKYKLWFGVPWWYESGSQAFHAHNPHFKKHFMRKDVMKLWATFPFTLQKIQFSRRWWKLVISGKIWTFNGPLIHQGSTVWSILSFPVSFYVTRADKVITVIK